MQMPLKQQSDQKHNIIHRSSASYTRHTSSGFDTTNKVDAYNNNSCNKYNIVDGRWIST